MLPGGESNMRIHGCVHLTISPQLAKFHDHRPCQRGYLIILICYVTTHYHFVKGSCDSIRLSLTISHQHAMFGGHRRYDLLEEQILVFNLSRDLT